MADATEIDYPRAPTRRGPARPRYEDELASLPQAYHAATEAGSYLQLTAALATIGARPTVYVGSGGAVAVARLAAEVHLARTGSLALATTPLGLVGLEYPRDAAAVIISSRAAHPDVALGLAAARRAMFSPVLLVTHRNPAELGTLAGLPTGIVRLPWIGAREGFLATRSVLAFAAAFAASVERRLPADLPAFSVLPISPPVAERVLILHGARGSAPAADLETRLSELGLAAVGLADYRNFAHGRHVGLARHLDQTLVVALIDADDRAIADATTALLPPGARVVRLESPLSWPASALDLLVRSMHLVGELARREDADPSRPAVPAFGRRLYHLSARRRLLTAPTDAVDRKLATLGRATSAKVATAYREAFEQWIGDVENVAIGGIVVDYDGTVCATEDRFALPTDEVRAPLVRLLRAGVLLGVASGRGRSLVRDLREWLPPDLWPLVAIGLYNGGLTGTLDGEFVVPQSPLPVIVALAERLANHPLAASLQSRARASQLTLELGGLDHDAIERAVLDMVAQSPPLPVRVVRSGHSLDIVAAGSKRHIVEKLAQQTPAAILAIGDQGQPGGNDHELLAATRWSLSVDRCSADPSRCWNLLPLGVTGPEGLCRYLAALETRAHPAMFRWSDAR